MRVSINFRRIGARVALATIGATLGFSAQAYDLRIANKTTSVVQGQVNYAACKADAYTVSPGQTWSTNGRGLCLIRSITAALRPATAGQQVAPVTAYSSSGTSFADFSITQTGTTYRVWSANELAQQAPVAATTPTGPTVRWEAVAPGKMPPAAAFKGGRQRFGERSDSAGPVYELLPVCRGESKGATAIGNAAPFYKHNGGWSWNGPTPEFRCYVYLDNKEQELAAYEVLIVDPQVTIRNPNAVRWVAGENGSSPAGAFDGAKSGQAAVACRAQHADGEVWVRVGTMAQAGCYFPYGGQQRLGASYEVLVVESGASQLLARGVNEPRLAVEPDRPARVSKAGEDCTRPSGRCQARLDELRTMGAYKINAVYTSNFSGNSTTLYTKTQGSIWEERGYTGTVNGPVNTVRPFAEVERNDNQIILFSGPWNYGGANGKAGATTVIFALNGGMANAAGFTTQQQVFEGTTTWVRSDPKYRDGFKMVSGSQNIERGMMAEPDTALALRMKPMNGSQTSTFWRGNSLPPPLVKGPNGAFGNYRIASSGDGWLELYTVAGPQPGGGNKWNIHFLKVDFWRNRVWELLGVTDQQPTTQDVGSLRTQARSAGPSKAWAEAYVLTDASVFSGANIGAALGRLTGSNQQVAWTLREEIGGTTVRWEELKSDVANRQSGVAEGAPVGRMVTEVSRDAQTLTLSGSELGSPLTIDWVSGAVTASGKKVGDFLTGDTEYVGQRKKLPRPTAPGISPGFQFINKTDWPVLVKVSQVGCLYHGVVPPQSTMTRNTGAVWFTLSASWSADGKDLTAEQVFTDCVAPVAFTTLGVIAAAATGGTAVGVVALGASSAATAGAATTAVSFMNAGGASQGAQDAVAAGIFVVAAAASGGVGAFQVVSTRMAPGVTAAMARSAISGAVSKGAAKDALITMRDEAINYAAFSAANSYHEPSDQEMGVLESWFDKEISLAGQYAGYPWPWKMKDRVMPQYEITGGPRVDTLKDGSKLIRKGSPFKFGRVN